MGCFKRQIFKDYKFINDYSNELIETLSKRKSFILELVKLENRIKKRNTYNIGYLWNIIFNLATIFVLSVIFNKGFLKKEIIYFI